MSSVTVVIAAYNAAGTIARAVRSALAEAEVVEVIVIDDASTDNTAALARACDDYTNRLRVLAQLQNAGPSAARNRAIRESTAPWLAILDADDFFLPGRIEKLLGYADDADFVADDLWQVDEGAENSLRRSLLKKAFELPRMIDLATFVYSNVTRGRRMRGELGFIKPLMRRSFLASHRLAYREDMRLGEDYELYVRALGLGAKLRLVEAQGYVSVVRPHSLSGQHSEADLLRLRDCNDVLRQDLMLTKVEGAALRAHYLSVDCRLQWRNLIIAVKQRNLKAMTDCFRRPHPVPLYLAKQLIGQFYARTAGRLFQPRNNKA